MAQVVLMSDAVHTPLYTEKREDSKEDGTPVTLMFYVHPLKYSAFGQTSSFYAQKSVTSNCKNLKTGHFSSSF